MDQYLPACTFRVQSYIPQISVCQILQNTSPDNLKKRLEQKWFIPRSTKSNNLSFSGSFFNSLSADAVHVQFILCILKAPLSYMYNLFYKLKKCHGSYMYDLKYTCYHERAFITQEVISILGCTKATQISKIHLFW